MFTFVCGKKKEPIVAVVASWIFVQVRTYTFTVGVLTETKYHRFTRINVVYAVHSVPTICEFTHTYVLDILFHVQYVPMYVEYAPGQYCV